MMRITDHFRIVEVLSKKYRIQQKNGDDWEFRNGPFPTLKQAIVVMNEFWKDYLHEIAVENAKLMEEEVLKIVNWNEIRPFLDQISN